MNECARAKRRALGGGSQGSQGLSKIRGGGSMGQRLAETSKRRCNPTKLSLVYVQFDATTSYYESNIDNATCSQQDVT
eukprot:6294839-Amphidinium_carterae.2